MTKLLWCACGAQRGYQHGPVSIVTAIIPLAWCELRAQGRLLSLEPRNKPWKAGGCEGGSGDQLKPREGLAHLPTHFPAASLQGVGHPRRGHAPGPRNGRLRRSHRLSSHRPGHCPSVVRPARTTECSSGHLSVLHVWLPNSVAHATPHNVEKLSQGDSIAIHVTPLQVSGVQSKSPSQHSHHTYGPGLQDPPHQ